MSFWLREVCGWLLVGLGLVIFSQVYLFCLDRWIFEAAILLLMGIFVFRGGIGLLKVAVAANVVRQTQEQKVVRPGVRSWGSPQAKDHERQADPVG
jgi:hypothetical protein